eukprot:tig00020960_g16565.t1
MALRPALLGCHPGGKCTRCGKHFTRQDNLYKHVRQCRKKAPATPRFDSSSAIPISSNMPHSCQMEGLDLAGLRIRSCSYFVDSRLCAGLGATCRSARFLARRPAGCFSFVDSRLRAGPGATFLSSDAAFPPATALACPPTWKKAPATSRSEPSSAIAIVSDIPRSCQMEGLDLAMSCSARPLLQHLLPARRPARCFSFVDSRLRAGPGATCRSARFPARRPVGCFSFVDSRLRAGPGAARPPAFPPAAALACPPAWCRRPRRHPTYPPRRPPALPL